MSQNNLEERVAVLERQVQQLIEARTAQGRVKDWRRTVGMFSGNELMTVPDKQFVFVSGDKPSAGQRSAVAARSHDPA